MTFEPIVVCPRCGASMRADTVKTAIWLEQRLFVVENIPAHVCGTCLEQFYDEDTTEALRRLTESGFTSAQPTREIVVPVFSLEGLIVRPVAAPNDEGAVMDY